MSGILGIWNLDGRPVEQALLARLNSHIAHRGPDGEGFWRDGPIGLAHQMLRVAPESCGEVQPLRALSGAVIVFDGRLDNRDELLGHLDGIGPESPDSALALAAYGRYGDSTPEKLAGDFALAIWDPLRRQLLLANDGMGIRPLYYCHTGNTFLFASEIKPILAHPDVRARPNEETMADWILRFPGADDRGTTFFEGIYSLPPAYQATIKETGVSLRRYWDFDKTRRIRLSGFDEYAEAFRHYFDQSVRRRMRSAGPVAISVSGGVDSSSLYCWATTLRRNSPESIPPVLPFNLSFPAGSKANEDAFLAEIERQYGIEISRTPALLAGPVAHAEEEIRRLESPSLDIQWASTHAYLHKIRDTGARVVLTGNFADEFLARSIYPVDYLVQRQWRSLWSYARSNPSRFRRLFPRDVASYLMPRNLVQMLRRLRAWKPPARDNGLFTDPFGRRIQEKDCARAVFPGPFGSAHTESLYREARSRFAVFTRHAGSKTTHHSGLDLSYPFLDRDLLSFLMAVPGDVVSIAERKKRLLKAAMRDVLPPAIANRNDKTLVGDLFNPIVAEDIKNFLSSLGHYGNLYEKYLRRGRMEMCIQRELDMMQGKATQTARRWCDYLGMVVWLEIFFRENNHNG